LLGDTEASGVIKSCLQDKLWFVRMHAVRALDLIMGAAALPDAIQLINDPAAKVREGVKNILARNIQQALPYLEKYLFSHDEVVRRCSADALVDAGYIPVILKDILSENPEVEQKAMRLLAGLVKSRIYFGLKRALEDFSPEERTRILVIVAAMDQGLAERIKQESQ
jgi:HEAT repeat protein